MYAHSWLGRGGRSNVRKGRRQRNVRRRLIMNFINTEFVKRNNTM
jgi:hypothetical protein